MKQTEAQLRASKKYHEKLENIQLRVPKGEKGDVYKRQVYGFSLWIVRRYREAITFL